MKMSKYTKMSLKIIRLNARISKLEREIEDLKLREIGADYTISVLRSDLEKYEPTIINQTERAELESRLEQAERLEGTTWD